MCTDDDANEIPSRPRNESTAKEDEQQPQERAQAAKSSETIPILPIHVALMRFLVVLVLGWIFFYAAMSANPQWTVETYIPWSFWLLHFLLIFGVVGGGWPLVAPLGKHGMAYWGGHGRLALGLVMTGLTVGAGAALSAFFVKVWWGYPLFPGGAWFGIGLFYITLWFVLDIQTTPNPLIPLHPQLPPVNMAISSVICVFLAVAIFQFLNYEGPLVTDSSNPGGPVDASWWFGCLVSIIVWVHNFASILVFQSWPFSSIQLLRENPPLQHAALTATTILLGWAIYEAVIAAGVDKGFYSDAIGASQISWSLYHAVAFDFWPCHRMVQPNRGYYAFALSQVILPFFWIWLCRSMLRPIYDLMVQANPMYGELFTVHTMIPWYSLHVVAPLLLVHQVYYMRWPLPPGGPPLGPMDKGIVQEDLMGNEEEEEEDDLPNKAELAKLVETEENGENE